MTNRSHWESVYQRKSAEQVSWYAPHLQSSMAYIRAAAPTAAASIIDVGGGESTLVDDLLDSGYTDVSLTSSPT
nr:hypothetical protein [uncultured Cupriavidus sp.]